MLFHGVGYLKILYACTFPVLSVSKYEECNTIQCNAIKHWSLIIFCAKWNEDEFVYTECNLKVWHKYKDELHQNCEKSSFENVLRIASFLIYSPLSLSKISDVASYFFVASLLCLE
jgi:hypothetical protein